MIRVCALVLVGVLTAACGGGESSDSTAAPDSTNASASDAASPVTTQPPETTPATTQATIVPSSTTRASGPSSTAELNDSDSAASRAPDCSREPSDARAGEGTVRDIDVQDVDRSYLLYVPTTYEPGVNPSPLVVNLHGATGNANGHRRDSEFDEIAEAEGVVVAYGEAPGGYWNLEGDVERNYVTAVIDDVEATLCIDPDRIYLMGASQGGDLSTLLSCTMADRIAAFATVAVLNHHAIACPDLSPVRVVAIVGATDPITIGGFPGAPGPDPPKPLSDEIASWIDTNGCDPAPAESMPFPEVSRREFECAEGGTLVVYVHPGGHIWPRSPLDAIDASTVAWEFLSASPTPPD